MKKITFWNVIWGLLFITTAGLIVLNLFGLVGEINAWTLILSIPIVAGVIACAIKMQWGGMFFLLGALAFIYRDYLQNTLGINFNVWALLGVVVLLSIGFHILFRRRLTKADYNFNAYNPKSNKNINGAGANGQPTLEYADYDRLYFSESFGGSKKYIDSENLSYVTVNCSFGGIEVYFNNAKLSPSGAVVDIRNSFGGVELFIPRDWNVNVQINNFFGGVSNSQNHFYEGVPTLTLRGTNTFGGIEIIRV